MVLVAEPMDRITILVMRDDLEGVLEEVARQGVLHLTRIEEIDEWAQRLGTIGVETLSAEYAKRRRRLTDLLEQLGCENQTGTPVTGQARSLIDLEGLDEAIQTIENDLTPILTRRRLLAQRMQELRSLRAQIEALGTGGLPIGGLMKSKLLSTAIGTIEEGNLEKLHQLLSGVPAVVLPMRTEGKRIHIIGVVLRRDRGRLEDALRQVGFVETKIAGEIADVSRHIGADVTQKIADLEQEIERVKTAIAEFRHKHEPKLRELLGRIEAGLLLLRIQAYCRVTEKTCLFSGWVPSKRTRLLIEAIKARTGGRAVVEVVEAEKVLSEAGGKVDVPVLFEQPEVLKPFQMLVSGYGTPAYGTIDPTLFVGITFLFMFGMMFGDVGHGLVLLVAGLVTSIKSQRLRQIGRLATYCGGASIVFGLLYGSIFGLEHVLPALWLKPLDSITDLFKVAVGFGVIVVSLGIILNIINSIRTHAFLENFFDKSGPLIGVVYWAGVGMAIKWMVSGGSSVSTTPLYYLIGVPLVIFSVRGPILRLIGKRRRSFPDGVATYVMESAVEILEIFMGYLANTVSFIRVAAFGLAHAGLFIAVFSLANVVAAKPAGELLSWLILIFGNILIILLEGLVVTIQALRLEYYEFFGKFFKGLGSRYQPAGLVGGELGGTK